MRDDLFANPKPVISVIHVAALPGAPANTQTVFDIPAQAVREATIYRDCGVDGIIIENMHDAPYLRGSVGPEIVAAMAVIGAAVKTESRLPTGSQSVTARTDLILTIEDARRHEWGLISPTQ